MPDPVAALHQPQPVTEPRTSRGHEPATAREVAALGERSELEGLRLEPGCDLSGTDLAGSTWVDVVAEELVLAGGTLEHASLADVVLERPDLANVPAGGSSIVRTRIAQGRAVGFGLAEARLQDVVFDGTQLDLVNLRFAKLERVVFRDCRMHEADLASARLTSVVFDHCDLTGVDLSRATFARCELHGCTLTDARGLTTLLGISMPWPDVVELAPVLAAAIGLRIIPPEA